MREPAISPLAALLSIEIAANGEHLTRDLDNIGATNSRLFAFAEGFAHEAFPFAFQAIAPQGTLAPSTVRLRGRSCQTGLQEDMKYHTNINYLCYSIPQLPIMMSVKFIDSLPGFLISLNSFCNRWAPETRLQLRKAQLEKSLRVALQD